MAEWPLFVGYPSRPETQREIVANGAARLRTHSELEVVTWEDLRIGGKVIITEITKAIRAATVSLFDVTSLNENVMFEVGYTIGASRRLWLIRDTSDEHANQRWKQLGVLASVGYRPFVNSEEIYAHFWRDRPFEYKQTLFEELVRPGLRQSAAPSVLLIQSAFNTDADRAVTRVVRNAEERGYQSIVVDPTESSSQTLTWYGEHVFNASAVMVHLMAPRRTNAAIHNARCALVAGLAAGMGHPVLMLAEEDYSPPIDYRELLYVYRDSRSCAEHADTWLRNRTPQTTLFGRGAAPDTPLKLAVDLQHIRLGEVVAEQEALALENYFVPTASYAEVVAERDAVFVGRKGAGKTANLLRAAQELGRDPRNLVVVVLPIGYELEGLVRLLGGYRQRDNKGYVAESLWKFLIYSEIAQATLEETKRRTKVVPETPEWDFVEFMNENEGLLAGDFAARLETAIDSIEQAGEPDTVGEIRFRVAEALHDSVLKELRLHLGRVLGKKERVAVLVDNLDKAWERGAEFEQLAFFIRGLLNSIQRISADFSRADHWRQRVVVTLGIFLRSDIYAEVAREVREPDKIPLTRLSWRSPEMLQRVVEERYLSSAPDGTQPSDFWRYFDAVGAVPAASYIASTILPRPRDMVYVCKEAVSAAVNKNHARVNEDDLRDAIRQYSRFAVDAMLVESAMDARMEAVVYEFVGAPPTMTEADVLSLMSKAGIPAGDRLGVLARLRSLSFLGLEYRDGEFDFSDDPKERQPLEVLADRLAAERASGRRYRVHPAFRSFLEIDRGPDIAV